MKAFFALAFLLTIGCGLKKDAKEMLDTSKRIEETSKDLMEVTCRLRDLSFQAGSKEHVDKEFEKLFDQKVGVSKRLNAAQSIFEAMLFQTWSPECTDEDLQEHYKKAVKSVFSEINDRLNDNFPIESSRLVFSNDPAWTGLGSLGMMMSMVNANHAKIMHKSGMKLMSFYDLVISGLSMKQSAARGELVPMYAEEALTWENEMVYLLQMRHNYYLAVMLGLATDIEDSLWTGVKLKYLWGKTVNLSELGTARLRRFQLMLDSTLQTRRDLKKLGYEVRINETLLGLVNNIKWQPSEHLVDNHADKVEAKFLATLKEIGWEPAIESVAPVEPTHFVH